MIVSGNLPSIGINLSIEMFACFISLVVLTDFVKCVNSHAPAASVSSEHIKNKLLSKFPELNIADLVDISLDDVIPAELNDYLLNKTDSSPKTYRMLVPKGISIYQYVEEVMRDFNTTALKLPLSRRNIVWELKKRFSICSNNLQMSKFNLKITTKDISVSISELKALFDYPKSDISEKAVGPETADIKEPNILEIADIKEPNILEIADIKEPNILETADTKEPNILEIADIKEPNILETADIKESKTIGSKESMSNGEAFNLTECISFLFKDLFFETPISAKVYLPSKITEFLNECANGLIASNNHELGTLFITRVMERLLTRSDNYAEEIDWTYLLQQMCKFEFNCHGSDALTKISIRKLLNKYFNSNPTNCNKPDICNVYIVIKNFEFIPGASNESLLLIDSFLRYYASVREFHSEPQWPDFRRILINFERFKPLFTSKYLLFEEQSIPSNELLDKIWIELDKKLENAFSNSEKSSFPDSNPLNIHNTPENCANLRVFSRFWGWKNNFIFPCVLVCVGAAIVIYHFK